MKRTNDLSGLVFGRLTVMGRMNDKNHRAAYLCLCQCGEFKVVLGTNLTGGKIRSCGCLRKENSALLASNLTKTKHGQSKTPLYKIWAAMKDRCFNAENPEYRNYGGRGIAVCEEWRNDFQAFYDWAMANGYAVGLSLDRIDNDGNYESSNCRWTTAKAQGNNTRRNHLIEYNGEVHTIAEWAEIKGINYNTLNGRIHRGWSIEKALS